MNNPQLIWLLLISSTAALVIGGACLFLLFRARQNAQNSLALAEQLESELSATSRDIDTLTERLTKQSRRVAWLESRARPKSLEAESVFVEDSIMTKPNITERRHRVLLLSRRGQDAATIANTLGMSYGEVELIISLNRTAA